MVKSGERPAHNTNRVFTRIESLMAGVKKFRQQRYQLKHRLLKQEL